MSSDSTVRRILPQDAQSAQMGSFPFAPQQYPPREVRKSKPTVPARNLMSLPETSRLTVWLQTTSL
ncbi:hypothetical protein DCS_04614 [Drechmeria coniospora]|uniref:Uncharacterized protein n=1 Tax=Drechmeria coniospora TaxID=98403 RepID=A0A151GKF8_DRECN|nr:hypothetical protein DCS_04614 [Drechmeria coniospora]KYK57603.1 hypothetical protein DCS_04614 [Drechmeria coniospora]